MHHHHRDGVAGKIQVEQSKRARVNLSTRRVSIVWKEEVAGKRSDPGELVRAISERGHETHIFTHGEGEGDAVGEPISVSSGDAVEAGTLNLTGPLVAPGDGKRAQLLPCRDHGADGGGRRREGAKLVSSTARIKVIQTIDFTNHQVCSIGDKAKEFK
ncbi:hypothetical protein CDO30_19525 (plasmid) [Sinorhizobium meliloti]|uniref:Uncharacterized protein n=1 Tax=Rhizobium meliloti (strain 1021) TaxID=266834 RepID=Q92ZN6_RHIME|nr:hypothetical protein SMa0771 [Sinorhizobium meliloti 1021]AGG70101.1 Hypothetical protein SM2011_a0771 [Sinorhizobium meliloti 2011]ASP60501.1 hypothetical protein CDO30_19525 [Sinorhizobium meliloti]MCK3803237.1 hypothetical protein [Sinorhizobium meliloti]RVL37520.1 hypothetical protein CN146_31825 [Sinorhizobium meliloti]